MGNKVVTFTEQELDDYQTKPRSTACCHCSEHPIVCPSAATKTGEQKKIPTQQTLENTKPFICEPFHPAITSLSIPFERGITPRAVSPLLISIPNAFRLSIHLVGSNIPKDR
ncbi:uncharacterized protein LOC108022948 isoform X3 [Drosophila biarmipes]|uniref:uncharacterized protein LOC108022948 isoform X3 n=1 Tax=Drosophila biarmipes TaxID=125945 RepID=UPI001CDAF2B3|nr:uncharacterized protein LOC108022948 isoform X3 [Drosophila biarmipes]